MIQETKLKEFRDDIEAIFLGIKELPQKPEIAYCDIHRDLCPFCQGEPEYKSSTNSEYPDSIYIQCKQCGCRTKGFVEFDNNTYSKQKSVAMAAAHWIRRKWYKNTNVNADTKKNTLQTGN